MEGAGGGCLYLHLCTQLSKAMQTSFVRRDGQRAGNGSWARIALPKVQAHLQRQRGKSIARSLAAGTTWWPVILNHGPHLGSYISRSNAWRISQRLPAASLGHGTAYQHKQYASHQAPC